MGLKLLRRLLAGLLVLCALLAVFGCMNLYRSGTFTREAVTVHLVRLRCPAAAVLLTLALILVFSKHMPPKKSPPAHSGYTPAVSLSVRKLRALRIACALAGAILLVLGIFNGGLHAVLVKAVSICTECIGLG